MIIETINRNNYNVKVNIDSGDGEVSMKLTPGRSRLKGRMEANSLII